MLKTAVQCEQVLKQLDSYRAQLLSLTNMAVFGTVSSKSL